MLHAFISTRRLPSLRMRGVLASAAFHVVLVGIALNERPARVTIAPRATGERVDQIDVAYAPPDRAPTRGPAPMVRAKAKPQARNAIVSVPQLPDLPPLLPPPLADTESMIDAPLQLAAGTDVLDVQQSIGTPYEIDTRGAILFLEETRDPMSFADERLVHLRAAGLLRDLRGIVFGHLSLDRSEEDEFEDFLLDLVSDLKVPVQMDFPAGHEVPNLTLPIGTEVELVVEDTTGWIQYREDALEVPAPA